MNEVAQLIYKTSRCISHGFLRKFIRSFLTPVDFTRTVEIPLLLSASHIFSEPKSKPLRILDIGSPQLLPLSIASYSSEWRITYVNKFHEELRDLAIKQQILGLNNIDLLHHDITLPIEFGNEFDYIFSCSVFEHILPENGGDSKASAVIQNYLSDDGIVALSVPYYKESFHEYTTSQVYERQNPDNQLIFFQRFYDEKTLAEQIIRPMGLLLQKQIYVGERFWFPNNPHNRIALFLSQWKLSLIFGRLYPILSKIFFKTTSDSNNLIKPYLSIIVLSK